MLAAAVSASAGTAYSADNFRVKTYDPSITYSGAFVPGGMYCKPRLKSEWRIGMKGTLQNSVQCIEARRSMELSGLWKGALSLNGACIKTDEPSYWATGNRLNYDGGNSFPSGTSSR